MGKYTYIMQGDYTSMCRQIVAMWSLTADLIQRHLVQILASSTQ